MNNGFGDGTMEPDLSHAVTASALDRSSKYGPPVFLAGISSISVLGKSILECNSIACESHLGSSCYHQS